MPREFTGLINDFDDDEYHDDDSLLDQEEPEASDQQYAKWEENSQGGL